MNLETLQLETGDLQENCYVLWQHGKTDAIVFDPGAEPERIAKELTQRGLRLAAFLLTHCHGDHIGALAALKKDNPIAPVYVPDAEKEWLQRPTLNLSYFYGYSITAPNAEHVVRDTDSISEAGLTLKAIHVPGHSPGGTGYFINIPGIKPHLFCGDILFAGSIGRTDLPGGEGEDTLIEGIQTKLFTLPDETIVHPGHGPETTIGREKRYNPFCRL